MAKLKILVVDDQKSIQAEILKSLRTIVVEADVDILVPVEPGWPYGCSFPDGKEWDQYDLAIVDLELFPAKDPIEYEEGDLLGGSEVLPYIRRQAPWLPVLAVSRLFKTQSNLFLAVAGGFGFDGHIPRDLFETDAKRAGSLRRPHWDGVVNRAVSLRHHALAGPSNNQGNPTIRADDALKRHLDSELPGWKTLAQASFGFATEIALEPMKGGFSGAVPLKAYVKSVDSGAAFEGEWVWKVSRSPWKLQREAEAHLRLQRAGFPFSRIVPLLWPGVMVTDRLGGLAYQFAGLTQEAAEVLGDVGSPEAYQRIAKVLGALYSRRTPQRDAVGEILRSNLPVERVRSGYDLLVACDAKTLLGAVLDSGPDKRLVETVEYQSAYTHGDLHTGNIMLGTTDLLIDFAWARTGPVAADAAKLVSDLLLRIPGLRAPALPAWAGVPDDLEALKQVFSLNEGDKTLFRFFLLAFLTESLAYPSLSDAQKDWISAFLAGVAL